MPMLTQRCALSFLGSLVVSLQLLVLYELSKHTTVVDIGDLSTLLDASQEARSVPDNSTSTASTATASSSTRHKPPLLDTSHPRLRDGSFNGIPLYYTKTQKDSTVACVGENYQGDAWMYRSCQFTHFCFDLDAQDFVLVQSPQERQWIQSAENNALIGTSTSMNVNVSLGGLNPKWGRTNWERLQWFPLVLEQSQMEGYYELPPDYIWIPFHSFAGFNAGHQIWDDYLPIHTLLSMFGAMEFGFKPLLTRYVLKQNRSLWATCDLREETKQKCDKLYQKFIPLMGIDGTTFSTTEDYRFETTSGAPKKSNYVCARHGAAGIGMLTDHGTKAHGWEPKDYKTTHNMGRGAGFYEFRNFMMRNLGVPTEPLNSQARPYEITFSVRSSESMHRSQTYARQAKHVENTFSPDELHVNAHVMSALSLEEQVILASKSAIFITSAGGGAVTATFLPRGATLIIYYVGDGSRVNNKVTHEPARLDWDLFNHASHLRVHWLPTKGMDTPGGLEILTQLIRNELHIISHL